MANSSEFNEFENKVVTSTVEAIKTAAESGVPSSILIPNVYTGARPYGQVVDPHFSPYVRQYYEGLPTPQELFPLQGKPDFVKYRIAYQMIFAVKEDLGENGTNQKEEYQTPFHIGQDSHLFYLTSVPKAVYHLFGWHQGTLGGRLDLVTVNIDFEELLESSKRIRKELKELYSW